MNRLMLAASAAALLAVSSFPALAAEATGAITAVDPAAGTVTLDDGNIYVLPANFDLAMLPAGARVKITYEEVDGKLTITAVEQAS
jgi:Cu/Ag efflux protein CusF